MQVKIAMEKLKIHIAKTLYTDVFPYIRRDKTSVFLIGANAKDKDSVRYRLRNALSKSRFKKSDVYYPEEIFADLLYDSQLDLLSLENLLASSVHVVIICAESWGSIAELGAFVNHEKLNKKLVVIINEKYKNTKSFIRQGPVRFLEIKSKGRTNPIIWFNFSRGNIDELSKKVNFVVNKISRDSNVESSLCNPIVSQEFLLILIHTLGTSTAGEIKQLIKLLIEPIESQELSTIVYSSLRALFKQRAVILRNGQYTLTQSGHSRLENSFLNYYRLKVVKIMDSLRIEFLNKMLRDRN